MGAMNNTATPMQQQPASPAETHAGPIPATIAERVGEPLAVDVDIVIPVYNEQEQLADSVQKLMSQLGAGGGAAGRAVPVPSADAGPALRPYTWNIVIADNASVDDTWSIAEGLVGRHPGLMRAIRIPAKGRGRALKLAWGESRARAVAYMDVDLSTDIRQTDELVGALLHGGADVSVGCRLFDESQVTRSVKREIISRTYNVMLQTMLGAAFHDAQCGFKAMTAPAARYLIPFIRDDEWFFDTEMLLLAQATGMRIWEFPVRWIEDAGTTVNIPDTVRKDLAGMWCMRRTLAAMRARNAQSSTATAGPAPAAPATAAATA